LSDPIVEQATRRGVTRLCHLTPYRNLLHIAREGALRSTKELQSDERAAFEPQDLARLDGQPDHICCTIQYPNIWYLRSKRQGATPLQRLFPDWVCLLINPRYLWAKDTLLCHRNAAAGSGAYLAAGPGAFAAMYADVVSGAQGSTGRDEKPKSCPTDDQAEVLVPKLIRLEDANHVVVADAAQARRIYSGLELIGAPAQELRWTIAPEFFAVALSTTLRAGRTPVETPWDAEVMHAANF
jgi:ssDNA thymidine ADP-ribosyltransferase, DarT